MHQQSPVYHLRSSPFSSTLTVVTARKVYVVAEGDSRTSREDWKFYATSAVSKRERKKERDKDVCNPLLAQRGRVADVPSRLPLCLLLYRGCLL